MPKKFLKIHNSITIIGFRCKIVWAIKSSDAYVAYYPKDRSYTFRAKNQIVCKSFKVSKRSISKVIQIKWTCGTCISCALVDCTHVTFPASRVVCNNANVSRTPPFFHLFPWITWSGGAMSNAIIFFAQQDWFYYFGFLNAKQEKRRPNNNDTTCPLEEKWRLFGWMYHVVEI